MNARINTINNNISKYRNNIVEHPLYKSLNSLKHIGVMMEYHAYAVWDFMSLLKAMQDQLTCTTAPWKPIGDNKIRRLVNSIVLEEESDLDEQGNPSSHFEMYLGAMEECGASTEKIKDFVNSIDDKLVSSGNQDIDSFLQTTFSIIDTNEIHKIAAAFTFGREDLIPDMFTAIVEDLNSENTLSKFIYYLERHIELDGGEHGPLAFQLISDLCGQDDKKWREVEETAIVCLIAREKLWDAIFNKISK
tara:strand:+ start:12 stop:755 length:744 start_codon:yes stop_codon:yes gene_type:complete